MAHEIGAKHGITEGMRRQFVGNVPWMRGLARLNVRLVRDCGTLSAA
jgi:hypothetical protein